jgi:competence protein ComEC
MNYARKREKALKKKRIFYIVVSAFAVLVIAALVVVSLFYTQTEWKYNVLLPNVAARKDKELRIHYVDVGQGDATVIELPDGKVMLIDGGDGSEKSNLTLFRYLNALKITTIDYLVATHDDVDHCGGLAEVVKQKQILRAFLPVIRSHSNTETDAHYAAYHAFYTVLQSEGCAQEFSRREITLSVTDGETPYTLAFLYPYTVDVENPDETSGSANNACPVIWLDYKGTSAIFTGDISSEIEEKLVRESELGFMRKDVELSSTEIIKVGHHGSNSSTCEKWLNHLNAKDAVISCGKNNVYGHPSLEVSQRLLSAEINVYRTDVQGTVKITIANSGEYTID